MGHGKGEHDGARACIKCAMWKYQMNYEWVHLNDGHDVVEWCKTHFASDEVENHKWRVDKYHIEGMCRIIVCQTMALSGSEKLANQGYVNLTHNFKVVMAFILNL